MDDLNALFDSVEGMSEDLKEYGTIGAAIVGSMFVWNFAVDKLVPANLLSAQTRRYVIPVASILTGLYAGRKLSRMVNRRVGLGVTVGLVTSGLLALVRQFFPSIPLPSFAGLEGGLYGAPVTYEEYGAGVSGGPITVEETGPGVSELGYGGGYAAVAS